MERKDATVRLVFRGEVLDGFARDDVMRQMGAALRVDGNRLAALFAGSPVTLGRALAPVDADRHARRFASMGARVHVEAEASPASDGASPQPQPQVAAVPVAAEAASRAAAAGLPVDQITCPNCGEVQPRRPLCRACATDIERALAAKAEAQQQERARRLAEFRQRRGLEPAPSADDGPSAALLGLGFDGRLGRLAYLGASLWLLAFMALATGWFMRAPSGSRALGLSVFLVVLAAAAWRLSVLRLHDFGFSGGWSLALAVPGLNAVAGLLLMIWPGAQGANAHGGTPRGRYRWVIASGAVAAGLALAFALPALVRVMPQRGMGAVASTDAANLAPADRTRVLPGPEARAGFERDYLPAPTPKAFAVSAGGSWGWVGGSGSPEQAMWDATVNCEAHRRPDAPRCVPVNVDGVWIDPPAR